MLALAVNGRGIDILRYVEQHAAQFQRFKHAAAMPGFLPLRLHGPARGAGHQRVAGRPVIAPFPSRFADGGNGFHRFDRHLAGCGGHAGDHANITFQSR